MELQIRILMEANVFLYRLTNGALGGRMGGQSVLLLRTVGRKSGREYTTPVNYYRDGEHYVLVASNWGKDSQPAWYLNLMRAGSAEIQIKSLLVKVSARRAEGDEYERLWRYVTSKNNFYPHYQQQTRRKIPIVILAPS